MSSKRVSTTDEASKAEKSKLFSWYSTTSIALSILF